MTRILKYTLLIVGLIILINSCTRRHNSSHEQIIEDFFNGLNSGDFNLISICISDSILTTEMDYILTRNRKDMYRQFQWDSVFKPNYSLIVLKQDSTGYLATISKTCKRIEFLQDSAMVYVTRIIFKDNRIAKISTIDYEYMDLEKWMPRRDSLSTWIDRNHPEIKGFVNDMTRIGAQNYLKAIEFFKTESKMIDTKNLTIVKEFISAINSANIDKITELMHDNHKFIDSQNNTMTGKENMRKAWITYLDWFPDYKIEFEKVFENDSSVALFGFAEGTYKTKKTGVGNHWRLPAAWTATIEDMKIKQWQVYTDSKPVSEIIEKNK